MHPCLKYPLLAPKPIRSFECTQHQSSIWWYMCIFRGLFNRCNHQQSSPWWYIRAIAQQMKSPAIFHLMLCSAGCSTEVLTSELPPDAIFRGLLNKCTHQRSSIWRNVRLLKSWAMMAKGNLILGSIHAFIPATENIRRTSFSSSKFDQEPDSKITNRSWDITY